MLAKIKFQDREFKLSEKLGTKNVLFVISVRNHLLPALYQNTTELTANLVI